MKDPILINEMFMEVALSAHFQEKTVNMEFYYLEYNLQNETWVMSDHLFHKIF